MKKELRSRLRAVLAGISPDALQEMSRIAAERLFAEPEYQKAEVMMVYLSHANEADTMPIVLQAWQDRKRVLAPQVSWESRQMIPLEVRSLDEVTTNQLGFREPIEGPPIPPELIDLVIVPGLGFDPYGNRLGRGRGFYDRFLGKRDFGGTACGLAFESQIVDAIPAGPLDVKINMLVTDQGVRHFDP